MNSQGFAALYLIGLILFASLGIGTFVNLNKNNIPIFNQNTNTDTNQPSAKPIIASQSASSTVTVSPAPSQSSNVTNLPKVTNKVTASSPTSSPVNQSKTITVSGFAYEDRTSDGLFNSDDPKLPNMQLLIYDSATNEWINSIYTGQDGGFTVTNTVTGNLVINPGCNENFCPKDGAKTYSSSASNQQFAFRSGSAPTSNNNGIIEGDLIIEGSRQYKFYLLDKDNNYYSAVEWTGGHFKVQNLPNDRTYIVRISYGDNSPDNTEVSLSPSSPEKRTLQIHVR